jgi:hypothetical protein
MHRRGSTATGRQHGEKQHRAHTVVEQRFAGKLGLQVGRGTHASQHFEHGNRVGR